MRSPRHLLPDSHLRVLELALSALDGLVRRRARRPSTPGRRTSPARTAGFRSSTARTSTAGRPRSQGYAAGENYGDTFRVEDGVLKVSYDKYPKFDGKFGHLFSKTQVLELPAADRVSVRRRPVPRRPGLGVPEQRRHDPRPVAREHEEGPGLPRLDRGPVPRRQRQGQAPDGERLHAGHEHRDGRQADHPALHRLDVEDLPRRRVGHGRGRGPRQRRHQAHRRRRDRPRVREGPARRRAMPTPGS